MSKSVGCELAVVVGIGLCLVGYYVLSVVVATMVAEQLPVPVRGAAIAWIQGTPQAVGHYDESDFPPGYTGQTVEGGDYYWAPMLYSGPENFVCQLPVRVGYVTSGYGDPREGGYNHTGIDYGTYYQPEDIHAPMGGIVTQAGWSYWLGWTVVVENNGTQTILGHMCCGAKGSSAFPSGDSTIEVNPGDIIEAGEVVGRTGETGNSTGIHLHFEVRHCEADGRCQIQDPSSVFLPGQDSFCPWPTLSRDR